MSSFLRSFTRSVRAGHRAAAFVALLAVVNATPDGLGAQAVPGGDFDICDYCGTLHGNTALLRGRVGFGTDARRVRACQRGVVRAGR